MKIKGQLNEVILFYKRMGMTKKIFYEVILFYSFKLKQSKHEKYYMKDV